MFLLLALFAAQRLLPAVFTGKAWLAFVVALYPLLTAASLLTGYLFDPNVPERTPLLARVNSLLSGRFEVWHHVFWATPYTHPEEDGIAAWYHGDMPSTFSWLGGMYTDGDVHHAIDNMYLALVMNKGRDRRGRGGLRGRVPAVAAVPRPPCGRGAVPDGDAVLLFDGEQAVFALGRSVCAAAALRAADAPGRAAAGFVPDAAPRRRPKS